MLRKSVSSDKLAQETIAQILATAEAISLQQRKSLRQYLRECPVRQALIRDTLLDQNSPCRHGILVLEGSLVITKRIGGQRMVFAQLNALQVANLQVFIYGKVQYSATVSSSELKYLQISESFLGVFYRAMGDMVKRRQQSRQLQISLRREEQESRKRSEEKEKMINKLTLPELKPSLKQLRITRSTNSLPKAATPEPVLKYQSEQSSKAMPSYRLQRYSTHTDIDPNIELKSLQLKSRAKKINLVQQQTQPEHQRNEKIFKEHLKSIIKRKLMYEKKQLGVLKAYRSSEDTPAEGIGLYAETQRNQIDDYFRI